jgi:hydroxypyruvate reductase
MPSTTARPLSVCEENEVPEQTREASPDLKEIARRIFAQSLADCSIDRSFNRVLHTVASSNGTHLLLDGEDVVALDRLKRVRIVAAGKAAAAMLSSLLPRLPLPPSCELQGMLISPKPPASLPSNIQFFPGGHPVPNQASFAAARAALSMLQTIANAPTEETLCIFLLSGGASAMMELPLDTSISLDDTVAFHRALVHCGASIVEINCVRKHFSAIKGGRLALAAGNAQKISLLVSDVPPAHLDALASGPTIADPTTVAQCREILARYHLLERFPTPVRRFFQSPDLPETPKPGELISRSWKLVDSDELAHAAQIHATTLGFHTLIDSTCDDWKFDAAANYLVDRLRHLRRDHPRICLISAGEVSVQVPNSSTGTTHAGGRNQHFSLYAATQLRPDDGPIAAFSAGSDGIDGNSPAAGAVVDEQTLHDVSLRTSAERALADFNSFTWLNRIGATIVTGPTGHNLRDLRILLADRHRAE